MALVIRDAVLLEDPQEFLLERLLLVVLLLVQDVIVDGLVMQRAYTEKPVSILPMKANLFTPLQDNMNSRRFGFDGERHVHRHLPVGGLIQHHLRGLWFILISVHLSQSAVKSNPSAPVPTLFPTPRPAGSIACFRLATCSASKTRAPNA